ncbi:IS5 family transposase [Pseudoalteromonas luteoviolacea]|uniref:IS5 family transposase n=1 Tax=Pseudoalteromonas luteoviolacea TaxID=43657 RepID=UPI001EEDC88D|nr:IS5 family transposase [Pseudoalteromonas luteoviolacea]MCF6438784.1 IS5 family transposase [Pseudoalteromonas luteoviolacea]
MTKKIKNWSAYNRALIQRGNIAIWLSDDAIHQWQTAEKHGGRGRSNKYTDFAIETCLTLRSVFNLPLRALEGFVNSLLNLMDAPIHSPGYSCLCKRGKTLDVQYRTKPTSQGFIDIVVDSTGLKVYGNGEWHTRKHRASKRRTWRKLHLAIDAASHDIVSAELSMVNVSDGEVLGDLLRSLRRNVDRVTGDGAYDTRDCYDEIAAKGAVARIPPRENAQYWEKGHPRNSAIILMHQFGLKHWKEKSGYHERSLAETGVYRFKQLTADKLTSRTFNSQHTKVMIKAKVINSMNKARYA